MERTNYKPGAIYEIQLYYTQEQQTIYDMFSLKRISNNNMNSVLYIKNKLTIKLKWVKDINQHFTNKDYIESQ
jgi:hypothetical protein